MTMNYSIRQMFTMEGWVWRAFYGSQQIHEGTYVTCSNACREDEKNRPRLTQSDIDGKGEQRKGFDLHLTQIRSAFLSWQKRQQ